MKTIAAIFILLSSFGCTRITDGEIEMAKSFCATHGGLDFINTQIGIDTIHCRDLSIAEQGKLRG